MTKYRIIEKKGTKIPNSGYIPQNAMIEDGWIIIPRYIVQGTNPKCRSDYAWDDLKEFTDLEEARKFKRDLDLEEGIVIE